MLTRRFWLLVVLSILAALLVVAPASAAPLNPEANAVATFATPLSGTVANQTGMAVVTINVPQGVLCYWIWTHNLAPVTASHIHVGAAGTNGPIVEPFFGSGTPSTDTMFQGCVPIAQDLALQILANPAGYYVNVHTTEFPAGAIRGQLAYACTAVWCSSRSAWGV